MADDMFTAPEVRQWLDTAQLVGEATKLGVLFRPSGAGVRIDMPPTLPAPLRARLEAARSGSLLRSVLAGGRDTDAEAVHFADSLGVKRVVITERHAARDAVRQLIWDLKEHGGPLAIDIETGVPDGEGAPHPAVVFTANGIPHEQQPRWKERAGLDPRRNAIGAVQLYAGGSTAYLFRFAAAELVLRSHWLRRQWIVAHNANFEAAVIGHHTRYALPAGRRARGRLDCTAQLGGLLYGVGFGGEGRGLAVIAKKALGLNMPKEFQVSDWLASELSRGQIAYATSDAIVAWRIWRQCWPSAVRLGRNKAYQIQRAAIPATVAMEHRGLRLDIAEHARQVRLWSEELTEARDQYVKLIGKVPPSSEPEIRKWLEEVLDPERLAHWPRTAKSGQLATRSEYLEWLGDIPSARPVLTIKAKEQLLRNFGQKLLEHVHPRTGRIHAHYGIASTKAGRFSARNPNLQQLPSSKAKDFKKCVVADKGNVLIGADYDQVELRAAGALYGDRAMNANYAELDPAKRDLHVKTAAAIAGIPLAQVTKEQRQAAKAVNYGSMYGIGAAGLMQYAFATYGVEMSLGEAEQALDRFARTYAQIHEGRHRAYQDAKRFGLVRIGAGRVVEAAWEKGRRITRQQCANLPVQGIAADCMLRALVRVHNALRQARINGGIVACIHDELLLEVAIADAEGARVILEQEMTAAFRETFPGVPYHAVATAKIGNTWLETK